MSKESLVEAEDDNVAANVLTKFTDEGSYSPFHFISC